MEVLPEHMRSRPQSRNRRLWNAMTPDKKPSVAENVSQCIKNARFVVTSSLVALRPKSSVMEMVFLTDLKCDALTRRINRY
jgi:hypothetical protein